MKVGLLLMCLTVAVAGCARITATEPDGAPACTAPETACEGQCVDTATSALHCGGCGLACGPGEVCSAGACTLYCPESQKLCGDACIDPMTDRDHCGTCDSACGDGEICMNAACEVSCGGGLIECDGVCRDPQTDEGFCGGCGIACAGYEDCIAGVCLPFLGTISPTVVSGAQSCNTAFSNQGREVAVDDGGRIYIAMLCGGAVSVSTSGDGGRTYSEPLAVGIAGVEKVAMVGGASKTAYLLAVGTSGGGHLAHTTDGGATFGIDPLAGANQVASSSFGVSLARRGDALYLAASVGPQVIRVWHGSASDVSALMSVDQTNPIVFGDILADPKSDRLFLAGDTSPLVLRESEDGGVVFGPDIRPGAAVAFSDWTIGGGAIYAVGASNGVRIDLADLLVAQTLTGLSPADPQMRAIAAATDGTLYAVSSSGGQVVLDRFVPGDVAAKDHRTLATAAASAPSVTAAPYDTSAIIAFTVTDPATGTSKVLATVQHFSPP